MTLPKTIHERLHELLLLSPAFQPPAGARVYPQFAPDNAVAPYVTYLNMGSRDMASTQMIEPAAVFQRPLTDAGFQFSIWGPTFRVVLQLGYALRAALIGYYGERDLSSPDAQIVSIRLENQLESTDQANIYGLIVDLEVVHYPSAAFTDFTATHYGRGACGCA